MFYYSFFTKLHLLKSPSICLCAFKSIYEKCTCLIFYFYLKYYFHLSSYIHIYKEHSLKYILWASYGRVNLEYILRSNTFIFIMYFQIVLQNGYIPLYWFSFSSMINLWITCMFKYQRCLQNQAILWCKVVIHWF